MNNNYWRQRQFYINDPCHAVIALKQFTPLDGTLPIQQALNIKIEHAKFKVEGEQSKINLLCVVDIQKQVFELFKDIRLIEEISDLEIEFL